MPLALLYLFAFFLAYIPIGSLIGASFGRGMLNIKLAAVIFGCLLAVGFSLRKMNELASEYQAGTTTLRVVQGMLIATALFLLIYSPSWAMNLGVSYR